MNRFASGLKRSYYGKAGVIVYRLRRDNEGAVFGADVQLLTYGDAFWQTYTMGDNTGLVATDSMKNFIQRETLNFTGADLESYCKFLAAKFLKTYPQAEGVQVSATEIPYHATWNSQVAFSPAGPERATASVEITHDGVAEMRSGIRGFRLLRVNGSAFAGFVRDQYTTLPDIANRPLHMWLDLDWTYVQEPGGATAQVRGLVLDVFNAFESGSIQQIVYKMGTEILAQVPAIAEVNLEATNRTWDTVVEHGDTLGIYTDPRPPYGCIGLSLRR